MMIAYATPKFVTPSSLAINNSHISMMRSFLPLKRGASFGPKIPTYVGRRGTTKVECGPYPDYDDCNKKDYWGMPEETLRVRKEMLQRLLKLFGATKDSSMEDMMKIVERLQQRQVKIVEYYLSEFRKSQPQIVSLEEVIKGEPLEVEQNLSDGTVVHLKNEASGAEVYLVGVVHDSEESANEVRDVVRKVRPNIVMLELDGTRYKKSLVDHDFDPFHYFLQREVSTFTNEKVSMVAKILGLFILGSYHLVALQGLQPGREVEVAIEEAQKIGAEIVFGDQDYDVTLQRCGEALSMSDLVQCLDLKAVNTEEELSNANPRTTDIREMLRDFMSDVGSRDRKPDRQPTKEFAARAPTIQKILVEERNEVMIKNLRSLSGTIVAVVELTHLDGIELLWREAHEKYLNERE